MKVSKQWSFLLCQQALVACMDRRNSGVISAAVPITMQMLPCITEVAVDLQAVSPVYVPKVDGVWPCHVILLLVTPTLTLDNVFLSQRDLRLRWFSSMERTITERGGTIALTAFHFIYLRLTEFKLDSRECDITA